MQDRFIEGQESLSALDQVQRFVTKVWEHPLLDQVTRAHRTEAKQKIAQIINKSGIPDNQ